MYLFFIPYTELRDRITTVQHCSRQAPSTPKRSILAYNLSCLPKFADLFGGFGNIIGCNYFFLHQAAIITFDCRLSAAAAKRSMENCGMSLIGS